MRAFCILAQRWPKSGPSLAHYIKPSIGSDHWEMALELCQCGLLYNVNCTAITVLRIARLDDLKRSFKALLVDRRQNLGLER